MNCEYFAVCTVVFALGKSQSMTNGRSSRLLLSICDKMFIIKKLKVKKSVLLL